MEGLGNKKEAKKTASKKNELTSAADSAGKQTVANGEAINKYSTALDDGNGGGTSYVPKTSGGGTVVTGTQGTSTPS